jgi:hypothetical protein
LGLFIVYIKNTLGVLDASPVILQVVFAMLLWLCTIYPGVLQLPTTLFGYRHELVYNQILVMASALLLFGLSKAANFISMYRARYFIWIGLLLYTILIFGPGLLSPLVPLGGQPIMIDWHYDSVLGAASQIADGLHSYGIVEPTYGVLWGGVLGLWEKLFGKLNFGEYIRLVQWSQLAFWLVVILCFQLWRPNKYLALFACLMLLATYLTPDLRLTGFPNHTGVRSIGFPLGALALIAVRNNSLKFASAILGLCWGVLLLINFETSVCVAMGYAVYLGLKACSPFMACDRNILETKFLPHAVVSTVKKFSLAGLIFTICSLAVVASFALLYRVSFGVWPKELECYSGVISSGTGGYIGLPFYLDPWAIVMFVCSSWIIVSRGLRCAYSHFTPAAGIEAALAAMLLVWLQYFVNRPEPWQLWTHLFLFCLMMSNYIDIRYVNLLFSRRHRLKAISSVALMTFIVVPCILAKNPETRPQGLMRAVLGLIKPSDIETGHLSKLSGVYMSPDFAKRNLDLIDYLNSQQMAEDPKFYLAANGFLLAKEAGPSALPNSIFFRLSSYERLQLFLQRIQSIRPKTILIESPPSNLADLDGSEKKWHRLAERIKNGIKDDYTLTGVQSGWEIWNRLR